MKKNNKGFTMLETLIAATLIISTLVFLYVQFNNLNQSYAESLKFNTVQGIHSANQLASFYRNHTDYQCSGYITKPCLNSRELVDSIYLKLNIKNTILMLDSRETEVDFSEISNICDLDCQTFIKKVRTETAETRLIVIYQDNTFASVLI